MGAREISASFAATTSKLGAHGHAVVAQLALLRVRFSQLVTDELPLFRASTGRAVVEAVVVGGTTHSSDGAGHSLRVTGAQ